MKISILGSGNMGRSLGMRWAESGHQVFFGSRDVSQAKTVANFVGYDSICGDLDEAAEFGEILVHTARAVPLSEMLSDVSIVAGKTVIDLNNQPILEGFRFKPVMKSISEELQEDAPAAFVVKAFNMFAQEFYEHSKETIAEHDVSLFMAGDSTDAKKLVATLAVDLGLTPVDAGSLENTRLVETMGDAIRYLIGGAKFGSFAALSIHSLPRLTTNRLGGRTETKFSTHQSA